MVWFALAVGTVAAVASFIYYVILLMGAFRRGALWGLAVVFLPFALVVYSIKFWAEAKKPFLLSMATSVLATVMFVVAAGSAAVGVAEAAQGQMEAEMLAATKRAQAEARAAERAGVAPSPDAPATAPTTDEGIDRVLQLAARESEAAHTIPANLYPEEGPIGFDSARRYVGEKLRVVGTNGSTLSARLVAADPQRLRFEKSLGNGTATFEFTPDEVLRLERLSY